MKLYQSEILSNRSRRMRASSLKRKRSSPMKETQFPIMEDNIFSPPPPQNPSHLHRRMVLHVKTNNTPKNFRKFQIKKKVRTTQEWLRDSENHQRKYRVKTRGIGVKYPYLDGNMFTSIT